jgi:hypothetical protein
MLFPHELYQKMSPEVAAAGLAYLRKEDRETYKTGLSSLAIQRKLRPAFIQKRSGERQIEWMVDMLKMKTSVAVGEHMLQTWLMKEHTDMLVMFLDKLEVDHDGEGSVEGELPAELEEDKLNGAIDLILGRKDSEVVAIYLHMFKLQRPVEWDNLGKLLTDDKRLALGGAAEPEAPVEAAGVAAEVEVDPEVVVESEIEAEPEIEVEPDVVAEVDDEPARPAEAEPSSEKE